MGDRETIDYDPVEVMLLEGRRALSSGDTEKARWFFDQVLQKRPDDPRALLGLGYVDRKSETPEEIAQSGAEQQIVDLVKEKKYEEALDVLHREALTKPGDKTIAKSIAHLEAHLIRRGLAVLGGPDAYWLASAGAVGPLVDLLNGERTIREVIEEANVPKMEAIRRLVALSDAGLSEQVDAKRRSGVVSIAPMVALGGKPEPPVDLVERMAQSSNPPPRSEGPPLRDPEDIPRVVHADLHLDDDVPERPSMSRALGAPPERLPEESSGKPAGLMMLLFVILALGGVGVAAAMGAFG